MQISRETYRSKVLGCWLGKNIGGTLGAPFEWRRQVNNVSFYTQDLGGEPLPNDDLDLQLLWLIALEEQGIEIDAHVLAEYWLLYITPHWSEYGNAKINLRAGLAPPFCGMANNEYKHSCGAFIRSEIWACIAPGCPQIAARYAWEDAIVDHGDGEGSFAEVFCAALESAAFVESDVYKLVDIALTYIPENCETARAVGTALEAYRSGKSWIEARDLILERHRGSVHMGLDRCISEPDRAKGFATGAMGFDVPSNIGLLILGILYGEGDFAKTLCITVNCGEDTDCTGATVGSLFGILHGAEAIPDEWVKPIGHGIKTACLNLGELGYFGSQLPQNVHDLTQRTERLANQVLARFHAPVSLVDSVPTGMESQIPGDLCGEKVRKALAMRCGKVAYHDTFFEILVDLDGDPTIRSGQEKTVRLTLINTYKVPITFMLRWHLPGTWDMLPGQTGSLHVQQAPWQNAQTVAFTILADEVREPVYRLAVECTTEGRAFVMLVPVTLRNGNLIPPATPPLTYDAP